MACAATFGGTFTTSLDRTSITFGETATLSLTFTGIDPSSPPTLPEIPGLEITYRGPSRQVSIVQGTVNSTVSYLFAVRPRQPGTFVIPGLRITTNGQTLDSQPLQLTVARAGAPPPAGQAGASGQLAFFHLAVPKTNVYLGEVLVVEVQLHVRQGVQGIQNFQIADFPAPGFNVGKMVEGNRRQTQIGGVVHTVVPLLFPLTPTRSGEVTIGPVAGSVVAQVPSRTRRRDPFFDQFGMRDPFDMFGGTEDKQVPLGSETAAIRILPLPAENVPDSFNGAVGNYNMSVTVGPTNVAVGDPVTVRVQLSGRGAWDAVTLPPQPAWKDFKVYPATAKTETSDPLGLEGSKTFEQVIVPEKTEVAAVPEFAFSFFDPARQAYRTLKHPAVGLIVRPGGSLPAVSVNASGNGQDASPGAPDIVHIKPRLGGMAQIGVPLVQRGWFLALQAIPLGLLAAAFAWRARADSLARNPRLRRQREVDSIVETGLRDLRNAANAGATEDFYAILFRLLQERVGERLDLPASAITEAVVEEQLRPRGVPEALLARVAALFHSCNVARYAAGAAGQTLGGALPEVESVLKELKGVPL